jgi:hypothetical protein
LKDSALRPTDRFGGLKVVEGKNPSERMDEYE